MGNRKIWKKLVALAILALMIGACGGSETPAEPTAGLGGAPDSEQADVGSAVEESEDGPQTEAVPATPTPTPAVVDEPAPEEAGEEEAPPSPEPAGRPADTPVPAVTFNGTYENTYFRGAADAPVTMFDYSDFL